MLLMTWSLCDVPISFFFFLHFLPLSVPRMLNFQLGVSCCFNGFALLGFHLLLLTLSHHLCLTFTQPGLPLWLGW